ncbi:MAG: hypothetical protein HQ579_02275 [Candidatus Omnitrophica bacterium]|nr:hypothetical protein [Candidatus Omnitrophota bacterium]
MRRILSSIVLILIFIAVEAAVILPIIANAEFSEAARLEEAYRWKKAGEKYALAAKISPFDTEYLIGYGDYLFRQSLYRKHRAPWLEKAMTIYERATKLNQRCPEYWYKLGNTIRQMALLPQYMGSSRSDNIQLAMKCFKNALLNDPNGFNISYSVSYAALSLWEYLDSEERQLIADRLKYVLKLRPWYSNYIFPEVWEYTSDFSLLERISAGSLAVNKYLLYFVLNNNLLEFYSRQKKNVDFYRQRQDKFKFELEKKEKEKLLSSLHSLAVKDELENWQGKANDGETPIIDGGMFWNGTINLGIKMPKGKAKIKINAKGTPSGRIWPYMVVELDGKEIGATYVSANEWKEYDFKVETDGGLKILSVMYVNDRCIELDGNREDRNLYVGDVRIDKE